MVRPRPHRLDLLQPQPIIAMQRSHFPIATNGARALACVSSHRALRVAALCALIFPAAANAAEVPKKAPLTRYAELWTRSPFTTPPKKIEDAPEKNPFEDLALRGIAPLSSGFYLITLVNKKNPTEVTTIDTERSSDYEVVKIERDSEKALGTIVHLKKGSMAGTVAYDEKLSTLKAPPTKKPGQPGQHGQPQVAGQPPMPPGAAPNMPVGAPMPRSRVVPPATPGAAPGPTTGQPTTQGGPPSRFQPGGTPSSAPSGTPSGGRDSRTDHGSRPSRR